jgi:hypothetical protein
MGHALMLFCLCFPCIQAPAKKAAVPAKKAKTATVANPLFQSKAKSFRIGGDLRVSCAMSHCLIASY